MRINKAIARRFCEALSISDTCLFDVLKANPDFPDFKQLQSWRQNYPWFAEAWLKAREAQGENLVQKCLTLAKETTPKNAHQRRVQFDIYKWIASRFHPTIYGDKPATQTTNVQIGVSISADRLAEIRSKLDLTRDSIKNRNSKEPSSNGNTPAALPASSLPVSSLPLPLVELSRTDANSNE